MAQANIKQKIATLEKHKHGVHPERESKRGTFHKLADYTR